jgi:hypothetical protein
MPAVRAAMDAAGALDALGVEAAAPPPEGVAPGAPAAGRAAAGVCVACVAPPAHARDARSGSGRAPRSLM